MSNATQERTKKYGSATSPRAIRMPDDLWVQLSELAGGEGVSRNEFIVRILLRSASRRTKE